MLKLSHRRRNFVVTESVIDSSNEVVLRPSQNHFDLVKSGIVDGVSSGTGLYDDVPGDPPEIFNMSYDRLDLADSLLRGNVGHKKASDLAEKGVQSQVDNS